MHGSPPADHERGSYADAPAIASTITVDRPARDPNQPLDVGPYEGVARLVADP